MVILQPCCSLGFPCHSLASHIPSLHITERPVTVPPTHENKIQGEGRAAATEPIAAAATTAVAPRPLVPPGTGLCDPC